jgi:hypothetical protein
MRPIVYMFIFITAHVLDSCFEALDGVCYLSPHSLAVVASSWSIQ